MMRKFRSEVEERSYNTQAIKLLDFCAKAEVSRKVGERFLAKRAQEFNGIKEVDENGDVVFLFGKAKGKFLAENLK